MFCPSCGTEYTIELKYCNRCGANLSGLSAAAEPNVTPVNVTKSVAIIGTAMTVITLGGFVAIISAAMALANKSFPTDPIMAIVVMGMITILVSDIFLARLLTKLINVSLFSSKQPTYKPPQVLPVSAAPQLRSAPQTHQPGVASVTENTTRLFEPAYRDSPVDDPAVPSKIDR